MVYKISQLCVIYSSSRHPSQLQANAMLLADKA